MESPLSFTVMLRLTAGLSFSPRLHTRPNSSKISLVERWADRSGGTLRRVLPPGKRLDDLNQGRLFTHGQLAQHHCFDQREDRGIGSDAERQRQQRDRRKSGALREKAYGVANSISLLSSP